MLYPPNFKFDTVSLFSRVQFIRFVNFILFYPNQFYVLHLSVKKPFTILDKILFCPIDLA